jgi:hypothetical protein
MAIRTVVLFLSIAVTSALTGKNVTQSKKSAVMAAVEKLQVEAQKVASLQTKVQTNARRLDSHSGGGGMMDAKCQEACPGVMNMLMDLVKAMDTSTTPAPGTEMEVMLGALCAHSDTLKCMAAEPSCKEEGAQEDGLEAMGCLCDCPSLMSLAEAGDDSMGAMCKDPSMVDCLFSAESCSAMMGAVTDGGSVSPDVFKKGLAIGCEREALGCDEKLIKMQECSGDALEKWSTAECEGAVTEVCCPWAEKIMGCMGKKCLQLQIALTKVMSDAGDADMKKSLDDNYLKLGGVCENLGIPASAAEADALVAESTGGGSADDEPPATGFACHAAPAFAAATALCAVVA